MNKSKKNPPAAEHGSKRLKGGGHPSSAQEDIDAGTGIADPGVPGSRTNPVEKGRKPQPAHPHPHGQLPALIGEPASEPLEPLNPRLDDPDLPDMSKETMTVYATARTALPDSANRPKTKIAGSAKTNTRMQPVLTKKDAEAASHPKKQSKD
jgi:hypothetical protein